MNLLDHWTSINLIRSAILVVLGGTLLLLAILRLRQYKLKERYAPLFLFLGLPFLVLAVWPRGIEYVAEVLHISYFTIMLLCVSTFLILTVFQLLTIVSQQDQKIATLAQMVGILMEKQKHLDQLQKPAETPLEQPLALATPLEPHEADPVQAPSSPARPIPLRPEITINPVTPVLPRRSREPVASSD